jgi:hypothetical protein
MPDEDVDTSFENAMRIAQTQLDFKKQGIEDPMDTIK